MNKWSVRLAGWYFIIWALLTAIGFILSPTHAGGFFGIYMNNSVSYSLPIIGSGAIPQIDLMALGKSIFLLLVGYFILQFQSSARFAALIVLWPITIYHGIYFSLVTIAAIFSFFYSGTQASATMKFLQWSREVKDPIILALAFAGFFLFYAIPTYFLMRKDVKRLFEKPVTTEEPTNILPGAKP